MCMTTSDGSSGLVEYIGICEISSYIVDSYGHQGLWCATKFIYLTFSNAVLCQVYNLCEHFEVVAQGVESLLCNVYCITGEGREFSGENLTFWGKQVCIVIIVSSKPACKSPESPGIEATILHTCFIMHRHNNKVCHYRIQQNESTEFYIDDNINFRSLEELIEFYKQSKGGKFYEFHGASHSVDTAYTVDSIYSYFYTYRTLYQIVWTQTS